MNYHKWVWPHRLQSDLNNIFNNRQQIEALEGYHKNAIYFFIFGLVIFAVISPAFFYFENVKPDLYRQNRLLMYLKYMLMWFYKIMAVPVTLLLMKYNIDIWSKFKTYADAQFSTAYENKRIQEMSHSLERGIYHWDRIALWVAVGTICIDVIILTMICKSESKKIRVDEVDLNQSLADGVEMSKQ